MAETFRSKRNAYRTVACSCGYRLTVHEAVNLAEHCGQEMTANGG